jgi:predicted dehydrogenase/threonine dehydrogenase-like Zn-dependent dehydrogenase
MKQVMQNLGSGQTIVANVPCPQLRTGHMLVRTHFSLVSPGTERMLVEFGNANLLTKARQQPDKVRAVLEKVRTDGLASTLEAVRSKLDQPIPLGNCNVGTVFDVGAGVRDFAVGDKVVSNGPHAHGVCLPTNLCARIPPGVHEEAAVFTPLAAIALQGIRLASPTLGESFVISGLGLIGLLAVQLLRASGCRVLGIDFDPNRLALAREFGAEVVDLSGGDDCLAAAERFSRGHGVDGVLIAAATKSNEPVSQAARMCRKRGRIVLIGVAGLELSRADFYEKELSFQVSCSFGPGRYEAAYEKHGLDYPIGFVRWTEQRNFEAVLDMMAAGSLKTERLVSHRFPIAQAENAYAILRDKVPSLGILLSYPDDRTTTTEILRSRTAIVSEGLTPVPSGSPSIGAIGGGNYASRVLLPIFGESGAVLQTLATQSGFSASHVGRKLGFRSITTDTEAVITDPCSNIIVIATRHDTHARFVVEALRAGKHVFVEKPLCLTLEELCSIRAAQRADRHLMVGFNRRFAPHVKKMKELINGITDPKAIVITANAGSIPADHWTQDRLIGGGRIIGEACHFVDLLRFLIGAPIVSAKAVSTQTHGGGFHDDNVSFTLSFADGSIGTVHYFTNGARSYPKERVEVFCADRVLQLDNFRVLRGYGWKTFRRMSSWRQDKGHAACVAAFLQAVSNGTAPPISFDEIDEVTRATIEISGLG